MLHKLGGVPFFHHSRNDVLESAAQTFNDGFVYFLQMDYPGPKDGGEGDWPFYNCQFHVFAKASDSGITFKYIFA
jgi:hypothetical protein